MYRLGGIHTKALVRLFSVLALLVAALSAQSTLDSYLIDTYAGSDPVRDGGLTGVEVSERPWILALTGDFVDTDDHLEWVGPMLARLNWKEAAVAILGNRIINCDRGIGLGLKEPVNWAGYLLVKGSKTLGISQIPWVGVVAAIIFVIAGVLMIGTVVRRKLGK